MGEIAPRSGMHYTILTPASTRKKGHVRYKLVRFPPFSIVTAHSRRRGPTEDSDTLIDAPSKDLYGYTPPAGTAFKAEASQSPAPQTSVLPCLSRVNRFPPATRPSGQTVTTIRENTLARRPVSAFLRGIEDWVVVSGVAGVVTN